MTQTTILSYHLQYYLGSGKPRLGTLHLWEESRIWFMYFVWSLFILMFILPVTRCNENQQRAIFPQKLWSPLHWSWHRKRRRKKWRVIEWEGKWKGGSVRERYKHIIITKQKWALNHIQLAKRHQKDLNSNC